MQRHSHDIEVPRPMLIAAGLLIASVLTLTAASQLTGVGQLKSPQEASAQSVMLRFADEPDGAVGAYDPATGARVFAYAPETGGFVRTALRAMSRDRRARGVGPEPAYEIARTLSGRLILRDPQTGSVITLDAFGEVNAADFAKLLEEGEAG